METASVIIMDEYPIVRMSIESLLQQDTAINVVLKTDCGHKVIDYMRANPVSLVILDVELSGTDGFTLVRRIKTQQENTKILFLSSKSEKFYAVRAIQAGANGFVSKRKELEDIYNAVEMLLAGYSFFPSDTLKFINKPNAHNKNGDMPLSNREVTVLRLLVKGLSNKEIGEQLLVSNKTISTHKTNIFHKLNITCLIELIDYARAKDLL